MKKEQSSIEWLIQHIKMLGEAGYDSNEAIDILSKEAKELHRKEIIEAVTYGNRQEFYDGTETIGEKYYTEKYGQ